MKKSLWLASTALLLLSFASAKAADFSEANPVVSPPAAKPSPTTTLSLEVDPEFYAAAKSSSIAAGTLSDFYGKFGLAHTFAGGWVVSGFVQTQDDIKSDASDEWRYYAEGDLGYKWKMNDYFTLTPSAGIGEVWGDTGITSANPSATYYAFYLAGDLKLSSSWTWNVFNARYRDAFDFKWVTPKVATGLTYNINSANAVYTTVGYSWKDSGSGLKPDKVNVGFGYKYNF